MSESKRCSKAIWFWLSFVDPDKPVGDRFLGVAIVQADSALTAAARAWEEHINPGGEVACAELPKRMIPLVHPQWSWRLLSKEEAEQVCKLVNSSSVN